MLRGKMIRDPRVIDDRQRDEPFFARPWQRGIGRQKNREAERSNNCRNDDETDRLGAQERAIRLRAIREISAAQAVADPKQRGQREIENVERARLRIGITVREPKNNGHEPERIEHPKAVPNRTAYPMGR